MAMRRHLLALSAAALLASLVASAQTPSDRLACEPGNGGLKLPEGFCAFVAADNLGAARHVAVGVDGTVYVAIQNRGGDPAGVIALRDTDRDGKLEKQERVGDKSTTGIALRNGYLYTATI